MSHPKTISNALQPTSSKIADTSTFSVPSPLPLTVPQGYVAGTDKQLPIQALQVRVPTPSNPKCQMTSTPSKTRSGSPPGKNLKRPSPRMSLASISPVSPSSHSYTKATNVSSRNGGTARRLSSPHPSRGTVSKSNPVSPIAAARPPQRIWRETCPLILFIWRLG